METTEREKDKDLATRPKKEEHKKCPFLLRTVIDTRNGQTEIKTQVHDCLGKECGLWVPGHKDAIHPDYYLVYEGCGLISNVFWEQRKRNHV